MKLNYALQRILFGMTFGMAVMNSNLYAANITSTQFTITGVLEAKTCSFNETSLSIDLPEVDTRSLNNSNSIQGEQLFTLQLNCNGGVNEVNITPSGVAVANGDSTLFLNTSTAKNVGLRLLDSSGNILTPDGQRKVAISYQEKEGKYTFSAGYARTGAGRVSGGSFTATVTFSLDYS